MDGVRPSWMCARLFCLHVKPSPLPPVWLKVPALLVFWCVCLYWHKFQRDATFYFDLAGEPGTIVDDLKRSLSGDKQVGINIMLTIVISLYALSAYVYQDVFMARVLNPIFHSATQWKRILVKIVLFGVGLFASLFLWDNWVAAATGCFAFFGLLLCGRYIEEEVPAPGLIGIGKPPRSIANVQGKLLHTGVDKIDNLAFVQVSAKPFWPGDDTILVKLMNGKYFYQGSCGRANVWRVDCTIVLFLVLVVHIYPYLLGSGDFNQCAGALELVCSLLYIPLGYTSFGVFGFRVAFVSNWNLFIVFLYAAWPLMFLMLGGKGCGTLTHLVSGQYLPQIWDSSATNISFGRGYQSCTEAAFGLGGESLLVASTVAAAWVHIMSNFSFIVGFICGFVHKCNGKHTPEEVTVHIDTD